MDDHARGADETVTCEDARERMDEYLDDELRPGADAAIRAHLAACDRCDALVERERDFRRFLARHARLEKAPPTLWRRIILALPPGNRSGEP